MKQYRMCGPEGSVRCQTLPRKPEVFIRLCGVSKYKNLRSPNERTAASSRRFNLSFTCETPVNFQQLLTEPGRNVMPIVERPRLAEFPIISYETGYTSRSHIDAAFRAAGLHLDVMPVAMDTDVIKTCVELGLGVGIVAAIA